MDGIPFFIEVPDPKGTSDQHICAKISAILHQQNIDPLPFAGSLNETLQVMGALKHAQLTPAIFVINTFGAKEILPELNPVLGETPALFLRRGMFAGKSGLMETLAPNPDKAATMAVIGKLTPRLTSIWAYGNKNSDQVASRVAQALARFLKSGNFRDIEAAAKLMQLG
jgi:hypothetical protein